MSQAGKFGQVNQASEWVKEISLMFYNSVALSIAAKYHISDAFIELNKEDEGLTAEEIVDYLIQRNQELKQIDRKEFISNIFRVMRKLVNVNIYGLKDDNTNMSDAYKTKFLLNQYSRLIISEEIAKRHNQYTITRFVELLTGEELLPSSTKIYDAIKNDEDSAYKLYHGDDVFSHMYNKKDFLQNFQGATTQLTQLFSHLFLEKYGDEIISHHQTIADIGGGTGEFLRNVVHKYPHIKGYLFDLKNMINYVRDQPGFVDYNTSNEQQKQGKIIATQGNFFHLNDLKKVCDADLYFIKATLHNWDDNNCKKILENIHQTANNHDATLILAENILPDKIPSYDQEYITEFDHDLNMFQVARARQRTIGQFEELLNQCGFKILNYDRKLGVIKCKFA